MSEIVIPFVPIDSTASNDHSLYSLPSIPIAENIQASLQQLQKVEVRQAAIDIFNEIMLVGSNMVARGHDLSMLPPLKLLVWPDDSVTLGWTTPFLRVNIAIEEDRKNSSWHIIGTKEINRPASLADLPVSSHTDQRVLLEWLLSWLLTMV